MDQAVSHPEALVELLAGRPDAAEEHLRHGYETLEQMGERPVLAGTAALSRRRSTCRTAMPRPRRCAARALAMPERRTWRPRRCGVGVAAKVRATEGDHAAAEALALEAVGYVERTDLLCYHGDVLLELADVLRLGGRAEEAERAARRALGLYERKGNGVSAAPGHGHGRPWPRQGLTPRRRETA